MVIIDYKTLHFRRVVAGLKFVHQVGEAVKESTSKLRQIYCSLLIYRVELAKVTKSGIF